MKEKHISVMVVKVAMVKDWVRRRKGLGLTMDDVVCWSVVDINIATTKKNKSGSNIVVIFDEIVV